MRLKPAAMVCGSLALFSCSQFERFSALSKQGECKSYLRMIAQAEQAHLEKHGAFTESADELGLHREQWYAYVIGGTVLLPTRSDARGEGLVDRIPASIRQTLQVTNESFTIACVADLLPDPAVDLWTVSNASRIVDGVETPPYRVRIEFDEVSGACAR